MSAPAGTTPVVEVGRLSRYINTLVTGDLKLKMVGVRGEVSEWSARDNGIVYFKLKDPNGLLECIAWPEAAARFPDIAVGADVIAFGKVGTYAKKSIYQLDAVSIELAGIGLLHQRFDDLRRKLEAEGLFSARRKKAIPRYPFRVALVGSKTADGTRDFLTQAKSRAPQVVVRLFETPVQGASAAPQVVNAIAAAEAARPDILFLVRGGGSYEDLFLFNDERIVRAIANCTAPTVAAIGHEADAPLVDFAADHRAATPTTAVSVLPSRKDLLAQIAAEWSKGNRSQRSRIKQMRSALDNAARRSKLADSTSILSGPRQELDQISGSLERRVIALLSERRRLVSDLRKALVAASPQAALHTRRSRLANLSRTLSTTTEQVLLRLRQRSNHLGQSLEVVSPRKLFTRRSRSLSDYSNALDRAASFSSRQRRFAFGKVAGELLPQYRRIVDYGRARYERLANRLNDSDPSVILKRGYAIVSRRGKPLMDAADAPTGTLLNVQLARGVLDVTVESEKHNGGEQISFF